ncbi:MAG: radical SAM protein [Candidatus Nanopelagicales bacterium]
MSIEVRPVGVTCNLRCAYCYETKERSCTPHARPDMAKLRDVIAGITSHWSLFGGEALLTPLPQLEELLKLGFDKFGQTGIQTNGTLISDKHIELFTKYRTHIGISLDGPGPLNDSRWAGTLEATRRLTAKTEAAIDTLIARSADIPHLLPSLILTLHKGNLSADVFPVFVEWLHTLDGKGIRNINLHVMEMDAKAGEWEMDPDAYADRVLDLWDEASTFTNVKFSMFDEILNLLQGKQNGAVCIWGACDPLNTQAVTGYDEDGTRSGCPRLVKDGQNSLPAEGPHGFVRQLALYVSPQEVGGCEGCIRWSMCKGNCPGCGEDGDWRYRSTYCGLYKRLFAHGEKKLLDQGIEPLSLAPDRVKVEQYLYDGWARGQNFTLEQAISAVRQTSCTPKQGERFIGHHTDGYYTHGDVPHGDSGPKNR